MTEFSVEGYSGLLKALLDRNYRAVSFHEADPAQRHLVLRHDIDMTIEAALRVAKAEAALGCRATYLVLLRSELYNVFTRSSRDGLAVLIEMGHEVGLHFDASLYAGDEATLDAAATRECGILESLIEKPVTVVSFHRPAQALLRRAQPIGGRLHTYMPKFFSEMGYCSDSQGEWRHGPPLQHKAVAEGHALQLLTHPIWWVTEGRTPVEKLQRFLDARSKTLSDELAANSQPFQRHLKKR